MGVSTFRPFSVPALGAVALFACSKGPDERGAPSSEPVVATVPSSTALPAVPPEGPPRLLYVPDAAAPVFPSPGLPGAPAVRGFTPVPIGTRCPPEMVDVRGAFCIDRYEATLVDRVTGNRLSPHYHPTPGSTRREYARWQRLRAEAPTTAGRTLAVPPPPEWQLAADRFEPMASSLPGSIPNAYLSGEVADQACRAAGKRLCTVEEWVTACRGEKNRKYPYSHHYEEGRCNVHRATHPARVLHGDASVGHLDPRLNLVEEGDEPLLRETGATPECVSVWGTDAAFEMVGNLDEWVDDPGGTFVGGFYSRNTREGCDARVEVHSADYYDYSLGMRCCR